MNYRKTTLAGRYYIYLSDKYIQNPSRSSRMVILGFIDGRVFGSESGIGPARGPFPFRIEMRFWTVERPA